MADLPSFDYEVEVAFLDGRRLPDGDEIVLTDLGSTASPGKVGFELSVANRKMWWKGLIRFKKDQSNAWEAVVAGDGKELPKDNEIEAELLKTEYLVLSKAKGLGAHHNVYHIVDAGTVLQRGRKYGVMWKRD